MVRGTDSDRLGARRSVKDSDAFIAPRPTVRDMDDDAPAPIERARVVPGARSSTGDGGWPTMDRLRQRDMVPMGLDEEQILYTGKHTRKAPVVREAEDEPWWVGRLSELVPAMASIVFMFLLLALVFVLVFKPEWVDWASGVFSWLTNLDGV